MYKRRQFIIPLAAVLVSMIFAAGYTVGYFNSEKDNRETLSVLGAWPGKRDFKRVDHEECGYGYYDADKVVRLNNALAREVLDALDVMTKAKPLPRGYGVGADCGIEKSTGLAALLVTTWESPACLPYCKDIVIHPVYFADLARIERNLSYGPDGDWGDDDLGLRAGSCA